ncbi:hypothetical protein Hypma_000198 [Hypsizygus marmoreus]|uniref:Uncharacterized protein n=1 Tax=Hypsizygus marmoreus TaxID=39966 RepID=A0A369JB49_HYPMA|nr:hypothetical protein Hypma_000198 [Hypsizygus marmoreus]
MSTSAPATTQKSFCSPSSQSPVSAATTTDVQGRDTAVVTATVLLPSEALAHAKQRIPELEAIFKSVVPKDPGFTIQSGFVPASSHNMSESPMRRPQMIYLKTSVPLSKFSRHTVAMVHELMQPYPLVLESGKDMVFEVGGPESWPRLSSLRNEEQIGDSYYYAEETVQRNIDGGNLVAFTLETKLTDDDNSLQNILTKGTVSFRYDSPDTTARVEHFATSTRTTHKAALSWTGRLDPHSGPETYGLVHVSIGMDPGTDSLTLDYSPERRRYDEFVEYVRATFALRLASLVIPRWRRHCTPQDYSGFRQTVWYECDVRSTTDMLWTYPIMDESFRERFSLPRASSEVYRTPPSTTIRCHKDGPPDVFSFELLSLWALPTSPARDKKTPPPNHSYRNVAISTVISFRQPAMGSVAAGTQCESAPSGQLVCEKEVEIKDPSGNGKRPAAISGVSLTTTALVPRCVRYCEDVGQARRGLFRVHDKMSVRHYEPLREKM